MLCDVHMDDGIWTTGQSQALIHDIPTCDQLVKNIMAQFETARAKVSR